MVSGVINSFWVINGFYVINACVQGHQWFLGHHGSHTDNITYLLLITVLSHGMFVQRDYVQTI